MDDWFDKANFDDFCVKNPLFFALNMNLITERIDHFNKAKLMEFELLRKSFAMTYKKF